VEFNCPSCRTKLELKYVMPMLAALFIAPFPAGLVGGLACSGDGDSCFLLVTTVLSLALGVVAYGLFVSIERKR
jgi:hypothetical protein